MVWSARDGKPVRKAFGSLREARAWRARAQVELRLGRLDAPSKVTLGEAAERWLSEARAGIVRTRSGDRCAGLIEPKSRAGTRRVPIPATLRRQLLSHQLRRGRPKIALVHSF